MISETQRPGHNRLRTVLVLAVSVFVVGFIFRLTEAGSLTPSALPAATLQTLEDIFNPLAGTYDSSDIPALRDGNVFNEVKCIIGRMKGYDECTFTFAKSPSIICVNSLATSVVPGSDEADIRWDDFVIGHPTGAPTSRYYTIVGVATRSDGLSLGTTGAYDCTDNAASPVLTDVYACNGYQCDFCQTTIDVQDYTGTCGAPVGAGGHPLLVGPSSLYVQIDVSDTATASWDDAVRRSVGTITEYGVSDGGPFTTDSEPVSITFGCGDLGSNTVTWRACNGVDCNALETSVTVADSLAYCP